MLEIEKYLQTAAKEKQISLFRVFDMAMEVLVENFGTRNPSRRQIKGRVLSKAECREKFMADMRRLRMTA